MNYKGINSDAVSTASFFAYKLTLTNKFQYHEREDIKQELILDYLIKCQKYNPSKGEMKTFVNAIMVNKAKDLLRERRHKIIEVILDSDDKICENSIMQDNNAIITVENNCDVKKIMSFLSAKEKALCLSIIEGLSISQAIKKCGVGKSTYYAMLNKIKIILKNLD
ncbi:MAG: sigma-70 family RNA polymerase sigma factor [Alphaproteobacteria bacterium]